jgi:hypothetical protein
MAKTFPPHPTWYYMAALEAASVGQDIKPFSGFLAELLRASG